MLAPGQAKYATARNLERPSLGGVVGEVSKRVRGKTLMPWQQQVADVAGELSLEFPGEFQYQTVIVTVPRQAGKSDLVGAEHTHRLMAYRDHIGIMTAQTGKDAHKRWRSIVKDATKNVDPAELDHYFKINKGKGSEALIFKPTGSELSPFAPTASAVHGDSLPFASIDEAWAFTEVQGNDLEGAITPTFLTVPHSQLWIVSTRGTANSAWLNSKIALGRLATQDPNSRIAFFEWSADEELADADPYSDATLAFHPAVGHTQSTRRIRDLGADGKISLGEWRRAYLNLATETSETAFDLALWDARRWNYDPDDAPEQRYMPTSTQDMVMAFDVSIDSSSATIVVGWLDEDDQPAIQVAATAPGTTWLRTAIRAAAARHYRAIVTDDTGANSAIIEDLGKEIDFTVYGFKEYQHANQAFIDRLNEGTFTHDGHAAIRDAIQVAVLRTSQTGRVVDAARSEGAVDALRATILAQHAAGTILTTPDIPIF